MKLMNFIQGVQGNIAPIILYFNGLDLTEVAKMIKDADANQVILIAIWIRTADRPDVRELALSNTVKNLHEEGLLLKEEVKENSKKIEVLGKDFEVLGKNIGETFNSINLAIEGMNGQLVALTSAVNTMSAVVDTLKQLLPAEFMN